MRKRTITALAKARAASEDLLQACERFEEILRANRIEHQKAARSLDRSLAAFQRKLDRMGRKCDFDTGEEECVLCKGHTGDHEVKAVRKS